MGGEDTIQEGKGAREALTYCTPGSTVPSTSAVGLGEMSSGRQQAAALDQTTSLVVREMSPSCEEVRWYV